MLSVSTISHAESAVVILLAIPLGLAALLLALAALVVMAFVGVVAASWALRRANDVVLASVGER